MGNFELVKDSIQQARNEIKLEREMAKQKAKALVLEARELVKAKIFETKEQEVQARILAKAKLQEAKDQAKKDKKVQYYKNMYDKARIKQELNEQKALDFEKQA